MTKVALSLVFNIMQLPEYISPSVSVIELIMESAILSASNSDSSLFEPGEDF